MFNIERQEKILSLLNQRRSATVHALAEIMHTSESTIRRDLCELEKSGRIRRTFGGAVLEETLNKEVPLLLRQSRNNASKKIIAKKAKEFISNGKVIFLDASTTVSYLVPIIAEFSNITVITNSPNISIELSGCGVRNYCTGGLCLEASLAYVGGEAESFVRNFNADIMFFSSRGISFDGVISDSSESESQIRKVMMKNSSKKYYLYDSTKLGKKYMYNLCNISDVDGVISEDDVPYEFK